ncbi:hypothetical protein MPSEU_000919700 [Mayamaea pseudoterrestris]|nr:hypothetical protein MPSEU_000919700 [Mayamaea pseudoterrestris]
MSAVIARSSTSKLVCHTTKESLRLARRALDSRLSIGFVPTMGALHEGHLALVREARAQNDVVFASIFVNPTQFAPNEDLDKYPRTLERDIQSLEEVGVGFDDLPEGRVRPGHFRGVATVVTKLFNLVQPTNAYFGQKDAAQCVLIRRIVDDLDMPVQIVVQETVREVDGLAMSSRNAYLTKDERKAAPVVYQSLCRAKQLMEQRGDCVSSTELIAAVTDFLRSEPLVSQVQYVAVDDKETMLPLDEVSKEQGAIISLACKVGSVRLIDNIIL